MTMTIKFLMKMNLNFWHHFQFLPKNLNRTCLPEQKKKTNKKTKTVNNTRMCLLMKLKYFILVAAVENFLIILYRHWKRC